MRRLALAREQWEKEADKRIATAIKPYKIMLARLETERDKMGKIRPSEFSQRA
jgi:hypothetical protein